MSIEEVNEIDFIGTEKITGSVVLTVSDHLDWRNAPEHLQKLQDKLNTYLRFCESGELYKSYPGARGRDVRISVVSRYAIPTEYHSLLEAVKNSVERAGFSLKFSDAST